MDTIYRIVFSPVSFVYAVIDDSELGYTTYNSYKRAMLHMDLAGGDAAEIVPITEAEFTKLIDHR